MFDNRPQFNNMPPPQPVNPVAELAVYGRSARRSQIVILISALAAVFMLATVVSFLRPELEPEQTPAVVNQEDEPPVEDTDEDEEPDEGEEIVFNRQESFVGNGSTLAFQLNEAPQATNGNEVLIEVLIDGLSTDARLENRTVTLEDPPVDGAEIKISYVVAEEPPPVAEPEPAEPVEPEEPENPVLIIEEVTTILAHPQPPVINIEDLPIPTELVEPEPPVNPGDNVDQLYPDISQEIKDLAGELHLSDSAKRLLYDHDPQIFEDSADPNYICGTGQPNTIIYGCWSIDGDGQKIHLLRSPSIQTTLAHELLHAIYYNAAVQNETDRLHELLDEVRQAHSEEVTEFLEFYQHHYTEDPQWNEFLEYSEMHSFIGSQFHDLPAELEARYDEHFEDRSLVIGFYEDWHSSSRAKTEENSRIQEIYDQQLAQWRACLEDGLGAQACRTHRPEGQAYQDYNACLVSYKTLMSECLEIKPPETSYQPVEQAN